MTGKYIGKESASQWIETGQLKWKKKRKIMKDLLKNDKCSKIAHVRNKEILWSIVLL